MMPYPAGKLFKFLVKAPILTWRLGLGRLVGHIFLLITARGRKSGLPRRTMTEYHVLGGKIYVPCAFGPRADWYKNITADPRVIIQTWQGAEAMRAMLVTDDGELRDVCRFIRHRTPLMRREYLRGLGIRPDDPDDVIAKKDRVTIFRFDPTDDPTPPPPPPLEADLVWVWPVMVIVLLRLWAFRSRRSTGGNDGIL